MPHRASLKGLAGLETCANSRAKTAKLGGIYVRVYLSGVMQGSRWDTSLVYQDYRQTLKDIILRKYPNAEILCPLELFPDAPAKDDRAAREVIYRCVELVGNVDVVVAFLPEASMGTAVELWESHKKAKVNIVVSPMRHNLMLRTVSDIIVPGIEQFEELISDGTFAKLVEAKRVLGKISGDVPLES
jgi:hypothetical protein